MNMPTKRLPVSIMPANPMSLIGAGILRPKASLMSL
jgi:hypothetical protein